MNSGRMIFSQLTDFVSLPEFRRYVARYDGNRRIRSFSCWHQFRCMALGQLTGRESLRDTATCLRALGSRLFHAGIRGRVSRSTLADANELRDWRLYADLAMGLIQHARTLYRNPSLDVGIDLQQPAYAFDSTNIDLCLKLFSWAQFRRRNGAVMLHTLIDLRGSIPCFIHVSSGTMADVRSLDYLPIEPPSFYVMDRGYIDFARLYRFTQGLAFFITRAKSNCAYTRLAYRHVDKSTGLRCDETIRLSGPKTSTEYPVPLRRISYFDAETGHRLVFLTNNFELPALTIALLYKKRWKIELFFKWIKQHLRIKAFFGTSQNAVKTQVWIAVSVYVLVAIIKKELAIERNLSEILQILSITLFEKVELYQVLTATAQQNEDFSLCNQLELFDL